MAAGARHILGIDGLGVSYRGARAVRGFSLSVAPGEIVGLVGESGSGKSSVLRAVAGLLGRSGRVDAGSIMFAGRGLARASAAEMTSLRGREVAYVFQDPTASLDPLQRVGGQFGDCLSAHGIARGSAMGELMRGSLADVGFEDAAHVLASWPHELSGGMCQRVVLAMSAALSLALLLADEPTSALDVTVQARIVRLVRGLCDEMGMACLFISHDLALVRGLCGRAYVMDAGRIVEEGSASCLFDDPRTEATRCLVDAVLEV